MADIEYFDFSGIAAADVVFVCPRGNKGSFHIRVSSTIVRNCSPVFNALLGPHFREGSILAASQFVTIDLPDDDADAMKLLFATLHSKHYSTSRDTDIAALKAFAIVVDKYDCAEAVAPLAFYLLCGKLDASKGELRNLLHCAYLLRQHEFFDQIARDLIEVSEAPITEESGALVELYPSLENERLRVLLKLSTFIQDMVFDACSLKITQSNGCKAGCNVQDLYGAAVVRYLGTLGLWLASKETNCSIRTILQTMKAVDFGNIAIDSACKAYNPLAQLRQQCVAFDLNPKGKNEDYVKMADDIAMQLRRPCLSCFLGGSVLATTECSHRDTTRAFGAA